jgi:hypothetical protein
VPVIVYISHEIMNLELRIQSAVWEYIQHCKYIQFDTKKGRATHAAARQLQGRNRRVGHE